MPCPLKPSEPTPISRAHTVKGSIHWFDPSGKTDPKIASQKARPYMIISASTNSCPRVLVSPVTDRCGCVEDGTDTLKYPSDAPIYKADNPFLEKDSVVMVDQVNTIAKSELCEEWFIGVIKDCHEVDKSLMYNHDLYKSILVITQEIFEETSATPDELKIRHTKKYTRK